MPVFVTNILQEVYIIFNLSEISPNSIDKVGITIVSSPFSWIVVCMHANKISSRIAMTVHIADINSIAEVLVL